MPLIIPDEALEAAGMTEREARLEIGCRLFEIGKLTLWSAAKLAQQWANAPFAIVSVTITMSSRSRFS